MDVWLAHLNSSLTRDQIKSFISSKAPGIKINRISIYPYSKDLTVLQNYAFIGVNTLEDAETLIDCLHKVKLDGHTLSAELSQSLPFGERRSTNQHKDHNNSDYFHKPSIRQSLPFINTDNGWARGSSRLADYENDNSISSLKESTSNSEFPNRSHPFRSNSPPDPPSSYNDTLTGVSSMPSTTTYDPTDSKKTRPRYAQLPPQDGYNQASLEEWVEESWRGRIVSDYARDQVGDIYDPAGKVLPPHWRK